MSVRYEVCGPAEGRSFDHYARLTRRLLDAPTAMVSIIETHRQVLPGVVGLQEPYLSARETPLSHSLCQFVVEDRQPLIVPDARLVPRLAVRLEGSEIQVVAYAGWPLVDATGLVIGSLCAVDTVPRQWTDEELSLLEDLAMACSSELQQTHQVALDTEHLARTILATSKVAMAFYDTTERLVLANPLAEQAARAAGFRLDHPPYAGQHVRCSDNQTPVPAQEQVIPRALRGELSDHEVEWIGPPGNQRAMVASAQQVHRSDGSRWGTVIAAHDVTDLARSLQVKDDFIATLSHELRTPLTTLLGNIELLSDELEEADQQVPRLLARIEQSALDLRDRVIELLDTADRRRHLRLQSTDLSALVTEVASTFGRRVEQGRIVLSVDSGQSAWALVDLDKASRAIEHVMSNAVKYTAAGGAVDVTVRGLEDYVQVVVSDNGVGMANDEVDQAFDSFWRSDESRRQAVQGIGIGLTVVREIVEAHHGSVHLESQPGAGTVVTLTFPRNS
ncbi:GAF domain-containing sensor histidine kinase [Nocardioides sp.]|uniref:GAF domain-containing sensor histidine kinase n=1 Tax=Nocardioides sp. TaxID=35761 RepID=UPI002B6BEFBD|nr:GAF domain-containing sensor histidine kinase [Nocardioides sp.]HXH77611.1 GAF domain-containing sensor histidine kinase [Nocardioides sp.]